VDSE
jgi:hypothetical protein